MAQPFLHLPKNLKAFPQDMQSNLLLRCSGRPKKGIWRAKDVDGLLIMVTMVVCLSFLGIFMVPIGLEKKFGLETMNCVGFVLFVVMNTLSFFSSLGVLSVLVLLQAMALDDIISESGVKMVMRICGFVGQTALLCATIAFVSAGMIFAWHL